MDSGAPLTSVIRSGSQEFLHQAHRNNWQRYLAQLAPHHRSAAGGAQGGVAHSSGIAGNGRPSWDICILTASDGRQADMVTRQLEVRRAAGLLPKATHFVVVADPSGLRIGSGGATLRIFAALFETMEQATGELAALTGLNAHEKRILVIHSGGDSRRLPHCSATGKLFARIPRVLPDDRASTIFDEFLINLSGVAGEAPPGVFLVSGDVLLIFDHLHLGLKRRGITGVSVAVPADMGTRHGVYVNEPDSRRVRSFLHKVPLDKLTAEGAVDAEGLVQLDTGLVWFDAVSAAHLAALVAQPEIAELCGVSGDHNVIRANTPLNLYGDLLLPLAQNVQEEEYLADASDGPATPGLVAARHKIWPHLRDLQFSVERLQPAVFVHFGASEEYWRMVATDRVLAQTCEWSTHAAAWLPSLDAHAQSSVVAINAALGDLPTQPSAASPRTTWQFSPLAPLLVVDSHLVQPIHCAGAAVIAGVHSERSFMLAADRVLHQLPVQDGYVTRMIGLYDDPKQPIGKPNATFLHQPWAKFLAALEETPATLWPHVPADAQSLWTAHLFPWSADREESLALTLGLQDPAHAGAQWKTRWRQAPRFSLAESFVQANSRRLLDEIAQLEDVIAAAHLLTDINQATPAATIAGKTQRWDVRLRDQRLKLVAGWLGNHTPMVQIRGYRALAEAAGDPRMEDRAFTVLAHLIEADTRRRVDSLAQYAASTVPQGDAIRVAAAARIDFGGGWTDTPPYSLELGGRVMNAAVTLRSHHPIVAEAAWMSESRLLLDSRDIDEAIEPRTAGEILAYANPVDPFALLKAALVVTGIVPITTPPATPVAELLRPYARGLRVSTQTNIPRGSGLGTSSIMAGAVLAALSHLVGRQLDDATLFDQVLSLEQMLTTGGGWQDQVGGLVGGIHLVTSSPGLPQQLNVQQVEVSPATATALAQRLCLVYTGQQRLAKNLFRAVVSRWMARDPGMVASLITIAQLADTMHQALRQDDLDQFGKLLTEHWQINQRMDPGCTNPFIDGLFEFMQPYISGCKLAGAGGGGFAIVVTRDADATQALGHALAAHYANTGVGLWPSAIATTGLVVTQH